MKKEQTVINLKKSTLFVFKAKKKRDYASTDPTNTSSATQTTGDMSSFTLTYFP